MFDLIEWVIPCLTSKKESEKMIETAKNVRFPFPAPSYYSSSSARLPVPVPEDDFRWSVFYPHPPPSPDTSSQRSAPGGEQHYTCRLRRALDKSRLQKSRSRDNIDDVVGVLRHGEHPGSYWGESGAPRCEYATQRQPLYPQPPHYADSPWSTPTWTAQGCGGGWESGVRTGCDVNEATTTTTSGGFCCRGNDGRGGGGGEEWEEKEEANFVSPPKITPFSGRIITATDHSILRPVPFKPVNVPAVGVPVPCTSSSSSSFERSNCRTGFSHNTFPDRVAKTTASRTTVAPDDGYASREWQDLSCVSSASQASKDWPMVPSSSPHRRRRRDASFTQTPSPSDSGVEEVEAMLREREMELQALRERMERNETAMMEVFEERRRRWERETGDVVRQWKVKVQGQQQRSFRTEQSLLLQIFKLQQENRKLKEEAEENKNRKEEREEEEKEEPTKEPRIAETEVELVLERNRKLMTETEVLRSRLKTAVEEAARKSAELISAQLVLKDNEIENESKNSEIRTLLADVDRLKRDLDRNRPESSPSAASGLGLAAESVETTRTELEALKATLELERRQWSDEKTKVITYQKHLQLNYVQMARKNKVLETELQRTMTTTTSELDGRRHGNECRRVVKEESFC